MDSSLVPAGQNAGFQTSGQVSWNDLGGSMFSFSFDALNRFRQLQLDAGTIVSARLLFEDLFALKPKQQNVVHDALLNLKAFGVLGKAVYVGFGQRSVLVDLAKSESGLACITLCATLTTNYDPSFAAEFLRALWMSKALPHHFCPAVHEWQRLVEMTDGCLYATNFRHTVEGLARLIASCRALTTPQTTRSTTPEALAAAVETIISISSGKTHRCQISGGIDCAWLAGFASFALDLSISISSADARILFLSKGLQDVENAQVNFIITAESEAAIVQSTDVILPLGHTLVGSHEAVGRALTFVRTTEWTTIFHDTFGDAFDRILSYEDPSDGSSFLLGLLERAFVAPEELLSSIMGDGTVVPMWRKCGYLDWNAYLGRLGAKFTELRPVLQRKPSASAKFRPRTPHSIDHWAGLRLCQSSCRHSMNGECLDSMCTAIVLFCSTTLSLEIDADIRPTVNGLHDSYECLRDLWSTTAPGSLIGLEMIAAWFTGHSEWIRPNTYDRQMNGLIAIAARNVCIYPAIIEDAYEDMRKLQSVAVVPGSIMKEGRRFRVLRDLSVFDQANAHFHSDKSLSKARSNDVIRRDTPSVFEPGISFLVRESYQNSSQLGIALLIEEDKDKPNIASGDILHPATAALNLSYYLKPTQRQLTWDTWYACDLTLYTLQYMPPGKLPTQDHHTLVHGHVLSLDITQCSSVGILHLSQTPPDSEYKKERYGRLTFKSFLVATTLEDIPDLVSPFCLKLPSYIWPSTHRVYCRVVLPDGQSYGLEFDVSHSANSEPLVRSRRTCGAPCSDATLDDKAFRQWLAVNQRNGDPGPEPLEGLQATPGVPDPLFIPSNTFEHPRRYIRG